MFLKVNFFSCPNIEKINRDLEKKFFKKENTSHNSINHIRNTNQNLHAPNLVTKMTIGEPSQSHNTTKIQQIYNQQNHVGNPPALPPKRIKADILPKLPPRIMKANISSGELRSTTLDLSTRVPIQTKSFSTLKPVAYIFDEEGNRNVANSSDFLTVVKSKLKSDSLSIENILNTCKILFNNLMSKSYLSSRYEGINNAIFKMNLCNENLLKYNNEKLPANIISGTQNNALRIASQYPTNDKKNMENFLNSLIENKIDTVYILASDNDIKDKPKIEKYFESNKSYNELDVKSHPSKDNIEVKNEDHMLNHNIYSKIVSSPQGTQEVSFIHIPDWKDHTSVNATQVEITLDNIRKKLGLPVSSNSLVHCLGGIGRTMEMLLVERMMNMTTTEKQNTSLEEMVHEIREKRTPLALYEIGQLAELTTYALANGIPLLKNNAH